MKDIEEWGGYERNFLQSSNNDLWLIVVLSQSNQSYVSFL